MNYIPPLKQAAARVVHVVRLCESALENEQTLRLQGVPPENVRYAKEMLTDMADQYTKDALPPREHRHAQLSRLIIDQWPLGNELGNAIIAAENEWLHY